MDRPPIQANTAIPTDFLTRNKRSIALDLKHPQAIALLKDLLLHVDVFIDPYRPDVLESLGLSPAELLAANTRLIVARLNGFRRDGPYAKMAGHDINYLAVSGILSQLGRANGPPYAPANILADFAGGGLMCAFGILAALLSRTRTGKGQVVESNMVDGSAYLGTFMRYGRNTPTWSRPRGQNLLDGGSPFYDVYVCKDGRYMAVGALEPKFFHELLQGLGLDQSWMEHRNDPANWPELRKIFKGRFLERTRGEWEIVFNGKDACCTPVLSLAELEAEGYEHRPAVRLTGSPSLPIETKAAWNGETLSAGRGGEEVLQNWMGWSRGKDYADDGQGLVKLATHKL